MEKRYEQMAVDHYLYHQDGYTVRINDVGLLVISGNGRVWPMENWEKFSKAIEFKENGMMALLNKESKLFSLFFREEMQLEEYESLIEKIKQHVPITEI